MVWIGIGWLASLALVLEFVHRAPVLEAQDLPNGRPGQA
jgi:hypothetical protein